MFNSVFFPFDFNDDWWNIEIGDFPNLKTKTWTDTKTTPTLQFDFSTPHDKEDLKKEWRKGYEQGMKNNQDAHNQGYDEGYDGGYNDGLDDGMQEVYDAFRDIWADSSPLQDFNKLKKCFIDKEDTSDFKAVDCLEDLLTYIFEHIDSAEEFLTRLDNYDKELEVKEEETCDIKPMDIIVTLDNSRIVVISVEDGKYKGFDLKTGMKVGGDLKYAEKVGKLEEVKEEKDE